MRTPKSKLPVALLRVKTGPYRWARPLAGLLQHANRCAGPGAQDNEWLAAGQFTLADIANCSWVVCHPTLGAPPPSPPPPLRYQIVSPSLFLSTR